MKTLFTILGENSPTYLDRMNKAEQLGIITTADTIMEIREIRNKIAHKYLPNQLQIIFDAVLSYTDIVIENIQLTQNYIQQRFQ